MLEGRLQHQAGGKLRWSEQMNRILLECKKMALELVKSDNPPRLESGRKVGYMQAMRAQWIEKGCGNLALTKQNLRDQAARLEKFLGRVVDTKECGLLRASSLVSYIEGQKSVLRKLKASFGGRKRQEEPEELNSKFTEECPGCVYTTITKIAAEEPGNARSKYKKECEDQDRVNKGVFSDITEAEEFWRTSWEENGSGD
ncbi:hypothetical protein AWC38_SpisGene20142 [Stylophora pistillata]|uniref:Uncharacterized protein n=1 Tax=Stylophora pistillata TaxID=50429 RepID=A0A2B4RBA8_STYPI|nr:hypothetical protein AWC38_SpisGene20142 [Stylophora pistillata]